MKKSIKAFVAASATVACLISSASVASAEARSQNGSSSGASKIGKACTITKGPNAGKKGTYTRSDWGELWCEGSFGGSSCKAGGCKDASKATRPRFTGASRYTYKFPSNKAIGGISTRPSNPQPSFKAPSAFSSRSPWGVVNSNR